MSERILHIISLDVPFPVDYGGAIDIYYRVKALLELGVKVYLHCYEYGRGEAKELEEIAEKVFYSIAGEGLKLIAGRRSLRSHPNVELEKVPVTRLRTPVFRHTNWKGADTSISSPPLFSILLIPHC